MRPMDKDTRNTAECAVKTHPTWETLCPRRLLAVEACCPRQAGFSLVEILVALIVLSLGLLGLAGLQSSSMKTTHSAFLRSQATQYAYDILDRMRANREAARAGDYDLDLTATAPVCDPTSYDLEDCDRAEWRADVSSLPGGTGSIAYDAGTGFVTVVVQWNDERAGGSTSASLTIQSQL